MLPRRRGKNQDEASEVSVKRPYGIYRGRGICGGGILYWKVRAAASLDILMTGRNMDKEDAVPFEKN